MSMYEVKKVNIWSKKSQELGTEIGSTEWSSMNLYMLIELYILNGGRMKFKKNFKDQTDNHFPHF